MDESTISEEERESAIRKIRNLLTLSEDEGATISEAMASAEIAQRLMDKYRLSYEFVMSQNPGRKRDQIIDWVEVMGRPFGMANPRRWALCLVNAIASANRCQGYVTSVTVGDPGAEPTTIRVMSIAGLQTDVVVCYELYWNLVSQMIRLSYAASSNKETRTEEWLDSFFLGCTSVVIDQLNKISSELENQNRADLPEGMTTEQFKDAIILVQSRTSKAREYLESKGMKFEEVKTEIKDISISAFNSGIENGEKLDLTIDQTPKISEEKTGLLAQ
jgi:hypothetical protein